MKILDDIWNFFNYLDIVDIIFLVAIISLLILLVTLLYFIKINKDEDIDDSYPKDNSSKKEDVKQDINDIIDNIEIKKEKEEVNDEEGELLDLEGLTKKLQEQAKNPNIVTATEYEKEQEEKAIISYDELLKKNNRYALNYENEEVKDDVVIRKVNLNDIGNEQIKEEIKDVRVISYEKEEAFLSALKELNSLLN